LGREAREGARGIRQAIFVFIIVLVLKPRLTKTTIKTKTKILKDPGAEAGAEREATVCRGRPFCLSPGTFRP